MKQTIGNFTQIVKGISTLDVMKGLILFFIIITALGGAARGGHSILDLVHPSFNPNIQTTALGWKRVNQIISLPDGKMLVVGRFNTYNGQAVDGLVRLNADATLDTTFTSNLGYLSLTYASMIVQTDGKILVRISDEDSERYELLRLNADGSIDPTFIFAAGITVTALQSMVIDSSGRIIVKGTFNGVWSIIRLNSNGSPDPTFQPQLNGFDYNLGGTQNNKIIILSQQGIQRLNEDGTIDSSFIQSNLIGGTIVQPDGKILVIGTYFLRRLNENGSNDTGFTTTTFPFPAVTMALANDGRITLATRTGNDDDYQIRRFLANGTADSSFTPYIAHRFSHLAVQADGGVLIGDKDSSYPVNMFRNDFVRLFPNGSLDPTFNIGGVGFHVNFPALLGQSMFSRTEKF